MLLLCNIFLSIMDRKERTTATSIKIPDGLLSRIDEDVETSGDFTSRTDYIIAAIRYYEDYRTKLLAERKRAYSENGGCDFSPSGSLQLRDEVKG